MLLGTSNFGLIMSNTVDLSAQIRLAKIVRRNIYYGRAAMEGRGEQIFMSDTVLRVGHLNGVTHTSPLPPKVQRSSLKQK